MKLKKSAKTKQIEIPRNKTAANVTQNDLIDEEE